MLPLSVSLFSPLGVLLFRAMQKDHPKPTSQRPQNRTKSILYSTMAGDSRKQTNTVGYNAYPSTQSTMQLQISHWLFPLWRRPPTAIVVHVVCATTKKRKAEKCSGTDGLTDGWQMKEQTKEGRGRDRVDAWDGVKLLTAHHSRNLGRIRSLCLLI